MLLDSRVYCIVHKIIIYRTKYMGAIGNERSLKTKDEQSDPKSEVLHLIILSHLLPRYKYPIYFGKRRALLALFRPLEKAGRALLLPVQSTHSELYISEYFKLHLNFQNSCTGKIQFNPSIPTILNLG